MQIKLPKNDSKYIWTKHAISKMYQYGISENRCKILLKNYKRKQVGIAPGTIAVCQRTGSKKRPTEIWLMYQNVKDKTRIISTWRYPGISKRGDVIPIPEEIRNFLIGRDINIDEKN